MMVRASLRLRSALMLGCAACGLGAAGKAEAQAFNASPTTVAGSVFYDRATPGVETITVNTASAIVDWLPAGSPGNPFIFLPAGNIATFVNGINNTDFAILNRILTKNVVEFDGSVLGRIQDYSAGTSVPGGTILFQSPGGILVGSKAVFDVGNLVLTSLVVATDGGGNFIDPSGAIHFTSGDQAPTASVITLAGAQITALNQGSYVAMIAPVVQHGGSTRVNGSAAYVAGEDVEMRVNAGLFDIVVKTGSANAIPLIHTGTTGGPASTGAGDVHRIYLVAVPKNQAITAILEGNVGFDPAVNAAVENGAIILSAGYSVAGGEPDRYDDFGAPPVPGQAASFHIRGGTISSDLFGYAVTDMLASGATTGSLAFQQDVSLFGEGRAHLFAGAGQTVTVGGNALVSSARNRSVDFTPINLAGGEALIFAQGGTLDIFGNATVDASAKGLVDVATSTAGSGTGGTAGLFADRGSLRVRGATNVLATGQGGTLDFAPDRGGAGIGGTTFVEGRTGGTVTLDGTLVMDTSGTASRSSGAVAIPGADGTGGTARVAAVGGGRVDVTGAAALTSNGTGGNVVGGAGVAGGIGRGGTTSLLATGTIAFAGDAVLNANGAGGTGPTGGTARGGTIILSASPVGGGTGGALTAANVTGTASAAGASATGNTPGEWHVTSGAGSNVGFANLTLLSAVNGVAASLPFSSLEALGGRIDVTQTAALATPADIRVIGDGAGSITGGLLDMDAGGDVTVTHTSRGANFTIDVTNLNVDGNNVTVAAGSATRASNRTNVAARAAMSVAGQMDGREIVVTSASFDEAGTGFIGSAATDLADLRATGNAAVAATVIARNILIASNSLGVAATGNIGTAATTQTELRTIANSSIAGRVLGSTILVGAGGLDVTSTGAVGDATTQQTTINATGNAAIAGNVLGRNILVASNSLGLTGNVGGAATDQTELRTIGSSSISGRVLGSTILIGAAGLDLTSTGAIGDGVTQQTTINATGNVAIAGNVLGRNILVASNSLGLTGNVGGAATDQTELRTIGSSSISGRVLGSTILVGAGGLAVTSTGAVGDAATQQTTINATGNAAIAGNVLARNILIASNSLGVTGNVGGGATDQTELRTIGNSSISGRVLGSTILVGAGGFDVTSTGAVGDGATQQTTINATGNAAIAGTVLGRVINVQGATLAVAAGGTVGGAGNDQVRLTSLGNAGVAGRVLGRDIQIASTDLDLTGAVGDAATQIVTLQISPTTQAATLGGAAQGPGYTLTSAEAGRIRADALRINAPALGANPALFVRDLSFTGGGAGAGIGTLAIVTPGIARVEGNLLMAGARAADGISFTATARLEVATPTGSIRVRDAAGAPAGTMSLTSNNLWVASAVMIDRLRLDPNFAGRDAALLDNGGADVPRGYVEAAGVTLNTGGTLFVQNTGSGMATFATGLDFGGITVGAGGLAIRSNATPATVTAFGRRLQADGSFITGYDFFFAVDFQTAGGASLGAGYGAISTFNTCIIATGQCAPRPPADAVPGRDPTTGPTGGSDSIQLPPGAERDDLVDTSFATEPLIEEPVTSGGESTLWNEDCDHDHDGSCDEVHP